MCCYGKWLRFVEQPPSCAVRAGMGSDVKVWEWLDGDVCVGQDAVRLEEDEVTVVSSLCGPWMVDAWEPGAELPFLGDIHSVCLWYFEKYVLEATCKT